MKLFVFIFIGSIVFFSCKKDTLITSPDALLSASADTVSFDTVFTSSGSVTQKFKIFNENNQKIRLSQIKLAGGNSSAFKLNIDGTATAEANDIVINANDSIYVFVQVNVDPSAATLPFILSDSILIKYNGNTKPVQLRAYGQNAIFLKNTRITGNVSWNNKLPYVIIGGLQVAPGATLRIAEGAKVFLHADAPFLVDGTLQVNGTKENRVIFTGDRLDATYKNMTASWPGIFFRGSSKNNVLKYTTIKNAVRGIIAQGLSGTSTPKLTLSQCIIDNIFDAGILAVNTNINADNCLVSNCGSNIQLNLGGDYRFINCTVATYNSLNINHKNAVLQVTDYLSQDGTDQTAALKAFFQNCIFWGDGSRVEDEIVVDKKGANPFSVSFDHVIYKAANEVANATFSNSTNATELTFDEINTSKNIYDFRFNNDATSPAIDAGASTPFVYDLDGKLRDAKPDIGCYER